MFGARYSSGRRALCASTAFAVSIVGMTALSAPAQAAAAPPAQLSALGTAYLQDFDTLVASGTGTEADNTPTGWTFAESGTGANTTYTAGTGSANSGDTYSFGATAATERALGQVRSGSVTPTLGAQFANATGGTITSLEIAYTGEQWRLGTPARTVVQDRMDLEWSSDA
ncbi:MAG TPA: hypothetical protein PLK69_11435, partial [Tetrasphaera sp.]|nr:hypothetical protein [Tetrasphaera sp.]